MRTDWLCSFCCLGAQHGALHEREVEKDVCHGQRMLNCDTHSSVFLKFVQALVCPPKTLGAKVASTFPALKKVLRLSP